jgi:formylglycine-generating enzyme required for sulfatase activity
MRIQLLSSVPYVSVLCAALAGQAAAPTIVDIAMVPRLNVQSDVGITNQIQYTTNLSQTNWVALTNVVVVQSPYWFVDVSAPPAPRRFYRVVAFSSTNTSAPGGMVPIPSGSFIMGDSLDGSSDAIPTHSVSVSAFFIETDLVSKALWDRVYQWAISHGYSFDYAGAGKATNHPVEFVNWYDTVKWCNARSEQEGFTPCYYKDAALTLAYRYGVVTNPFVNWTRSGYRLPTEAEWEKAARGGSVGRRFPWGDLITQDYANYYSSTADPYDVSATRGYDALFTAGGTPYTSPVGFFGPNGYGLFDMAGNLSEWCWDYYDAAYYGSSPGTDPRGPGSSPSGSSYHVQRGGSWVGYARYARCAGRSFNDPTIGNLYTGFRCVRAYPP